MDAEEKFGHWLDTAEDDIGTADAMAASGRWPYVVFMCQQAIEKLVKGLRGCIFCMLTTMCRDCTISVP